MDFFDQMAKKVSLGTNVVSRKTDELIAAAELKMTISKVENEIEEAIYQLGENIFNNFISTNNMSTNEVKVRCKEIQRMYQSINRLQKNYNAYKGIVGCSACGSDIENGSRYCWNCGNKID